MTVVFGLGTRLLVRMRTSLETTTLNVLTASDTSKCLGYLWNHDLSAKPSIDHNIMKARKSFFCLRKYRHLPRRSLTLVRPLCGGNLYPANPPICLSQNSIQTLDSLGHTLKIPCFLSPARVLFCSTERNCYWIMTLWILLISICTCAFSSGTILT